MACADVISALRDEHEYFTSLLIDALSLREFWFLRQAHVASAEASGGQMEYVYEFGRLDAVLGSNYSSSSHLILPAEAARWGETKN